MRSNPPETIRKLLPGGVGGDRAVQPGQHVVILPGPPAPATSPDWADPTQAWGFGNDSRVTGTTQTFTKAYNNEAPPEDRRYFLIVVIQVRTDSVAPLLPVVTDITHGADVSIVQSVTWSASTNRGRIDIFAARSGGDWTIDTGTTASKTVTIQQMGGQGIRVPTVFPDDLFADVDSGSGSGTTLNITKSKASAFNEGLLVLATFNARTGPPIDVSNNEDYGTTTISGGSFGQDSAYASIANYWQQASDLNPAVDFDLVNLTGDWAWIWLETWSAAA